MTQREAVEALLKQIDWPSAAAAEADRRIELESSPLPSERAGAHSTTFFIGSGTGLSVFNQGAFVAEVGGMENTFTLQEAPRRSVIDEMQDEIAQLKTRVAALEREGETFKAAEAEIVMLRTISKKQAMEEIRALFAQGDVYYISEVAERLSLPDNQVVSIIQALEKEGEIQQHERL